MDIWGLLMGLVQTVAPALVDGFGVKLKVARCEPCVDRHLLTDTIDIDPGLVHRLRSLAPFSNATLDTTLTAAQLEEAVRDLSISAHQAEGAFRDINSRTSELLSWEGRAVSREQKQQFLTELLSSHPPIVLKAIVAGIRHGQPLAVPAEAEFKAKGIDKIADVTAAPQASGGFILRLPAAAFPISTGRPLDTAKLEPAVRALSYFYIPAIRDLLGQANDRLASFHLDKEAIQLVQKRLLACQPLLLEVFVANGRKLPVAVRSEAKLFVRGGTWRGEGEIPLLRVPNTSGQSQQHETAGPEEPSIIDAGSGKMFVYLSTSRMNALAEGFPGFMKLHQHKWRVELRRADSDNAKPAWLRRKFRVPPP